MTEKRLRDADKQSKGAAACPLAVRRLCLREMQLHAHRCRSRTRQKPPRPCRWSARPSPQDFPPCPLPFDKPASRAPLVSARGSAHTAPENKTDRAAMQLHAHRWPLAHSAEDAPPMPLAARLRRIFRRACCSSTSLLAVRRSCPREMPRTPHLKTKLTARQCSSTPTGVARALGRRRAVRAAGLPARPAGFSAVPAALR